MYAHSPYHPSIVWSVGSIMMDSHGVFLQALYSASVLASSIFT